MKIHLTPNLIIFGNYSIPRPTYALRERIFYVGKCKEGKGGVVFSIGSKHVRP